MNLKKHLVKKTISFLAVLALFISFGSPLFASKVVRAANQVPTDKDKALGQVMNIAEGSTVTAYQIVKGNYNDNGFVSYVFNDNLGNGLTIKDPTKPTKEEIVAISRDANALNKLPADEKVTMTPEQSNKTTYSAELSAGYWLVIASAKDGNTTVYNPVLLGIYYSVGGSDNTMVQDPVDANTNWSLDGSKAWDKKIEPTIKKEILNPYNGNNKGADQAVGENFDFQLTSLIPGYSDEYTSVKYIITDSLSEGLTYNDNSIKVTVGGQPVQAGDDTFTFTKIDNNNIKLDFNSDYALKNPGAQVIVTYSAKLNENAKYNFDPNTNDVNLEYSNNPDVTKDTTNISDRTYQYTFGIDGDLFGSSQDQNKITSEVIKTDENGKVTNVKREESNELGNKVTGPLSGAEFTLTPVNNTPGEVKTAVSDVKGRIKFTGLATGEYNLVETKAPQGYALNSTVQTVKITAQYNPEGTLKSYSITINGKNTSTYTATYDKNGNVTAIENDVNTSIIKNTKLGKLPSTGGMGTYLFTFVGVALMAGAMGSYFLFGKKRSIK